MENTGEKPRQPSATGGRQETGTYGASEAVLKAAERGRKAKDAPHTVPRTQERAEEEPPKEDTPKEDTPGRTAADVEREDKTAFTAAGTRSTMRGPILDHQWWRKE